MRHIVAHEYLMVWTVWIALARYRPGGTEMFWVDGKIVQIIRMSREEMEVETRGEVNVSVIQSVWNDCSSWPSRYWSQYMFVGHFILSAYPDVIWITILQSRQWLSSGIAVALSTSVRPSVSNTSGRLLIAAGNSPYVCHFLSSGWRAPILKRPVIVSRDRLFS